MRKLMLAFSAATMVATTMIPMVPAEARKSGEIEYIPAGITHRLTNTGTKPARFIVVLWR